jgi:glycine/D-amino acid oxidase-like deaminating enzyme/nitrite reductase/ring-hydroxylating ferredoxin subunit
MDSNKLTNKGYIMTSSPNQLASTARGESLSLWMDTVQMPKTPRLNETIKADVCIVGAGIAGLTTAYLLMKQGKDVCVIEDYEIGSGQTGRTTAHFSTALEYRYFELESFHGEDGAFLIADSHCSAIKKVEQIVKEENLDCDFEFVDGYLFSELEENEDVLYDELKATHRAGLIKVGLVERAPLEPFYSGLALKFPRQLQLHPLKYLKGLAEAILKGGGRIYTRTHALEIVGGEEAFVKTADGYSINAKSIVVATNTPINDIFAIHTKQAPYRSYVLTFKIPKNSVTKGLYWDIEDPYHYIRTQPSEGFDLLIIGGEDHKTGQNKKPEECYNRLEKWARERFPMAEDILYRWSGQVMESMDGLGFLGHNPLDKDNVYVITADCGNGMTHSTVGAMIITDQIFGRKNKWEKLYDPSRVIFKATRNFLRENINVASQYGSWFSGEEFEKIHEIPRGEGVVVRNGLTQIAAFKDLDGRLEFKSAVCPHLGCIVAWNSAEKSWDCPCHGSRFSCHGQVLEGPATTDLPTIEDPETHVVDPALVGDFGMPSLSV